MFPKALRALLFLAGLLAAVIPFEAASDYSLPYHFTTLAGVSSIGSQDGAGTDARFYQPVDLTTDAAGNIFIVDAGNHLIRKVTPAGTVTTFAGAAGQPGSADGTGSAARFDNPQDIVADAADNLYVTDSGNHTIRKITPAGVVTTVTGLAGVSGNTDGAGGLARFNRPRGIAMDPAGSLYVTEAGNSAVRKITPAGVVSTLASFLSFPDGTGIPYVADPSAYGAIAVDGAGNVYVSRFFTTDYHNAYDERGFLLAWEYVNDVGYVHKISPEGVVSWVRSTSINRYPPGSSANDFAARDLAIDAGGQLVILPYKRALDRSGNAYRFFDNTLRKINPAGETTTLAGLALTTAQGIADGTGPVARFQNPAGAALDAAGNLYVTDSISHCIRKITPAGAVTTLAGAPGLPGSADGPGSTARFSGPTSVAVDAAGTLYVADTGNHVIRKILPSGETSTFAGTAGAPGWQDGTGPAAHFSYPYGIAVDATGNVYVTSASTVRKITPQGVTTTLAGHDSDVGYVDGIGSGARFAVPYGIAVDAGGNVYVTEAPDGPAIARIRKITPAGGVTTVAGGEHGSTDGNGTAARFHNPYGIAIDATGHLFIADAFNQTIRKISPQGAVTTLAGLIDAPGGTDGTGREARFYYPRGIAVDPAGTLYVTSSTTIRKGVPATLPVLTTQPAGMSITAGNSAAFSVTAGGTPTPTFQWQFNGSAIPGATSNALNLANVRTSDAGDYTVLVTNALGSVTSAKATLAVTSAPTPTPPAPSGGGSGGGGAPSIWFLLAAGGLRLLRHRFRRLAGRN